MKLTLEIKDNKFSYDYEVGEYSKGHGDMPMTAENLTWFCNVLNNCHKQYLYKLETMDKEENALAYIEKHPEILKKARVK
jgi:hypothetical protein